jgi:2'-5' RNA ligase
VDRRPYRAHLTLGRVRRPPLKDAAATRAALGVAAGRPFRVDELVLFRSHLGPKPRYEVLDAWPFTAPAPA